MRTVSSSEFVSSQKFEEQVVEEVSGEDEEQEHVLSVSVAGAGGILANFGSEQDSEGVHGKAVNSGRSCGAE